MSVRMKRICRKMVALIICLLVASSSVQGTVLCFGADGHIEFESAFHDQCSDHAHSCPHDRDSPGAECGEEGKHCHCGPCVDVPVDIGIAKISQTAEQLDRDFALAVIAADVVITCEQPCYLESNPVWTALILTSYFTPLRTIILLA